MLLVSSYREFNVTVVEAERLSGVTASADPEQLAGVQDEAEGFFQGFFRTPRSMNHAPRGGWHPPTDVFETADEVVVKMEIAGVRKKDLEVTFENQCLRVRGRREERFPKKKVAVTQMEVEFGVFERAVQIRQPVEVDGIDASYAEGFLVIRLPKLRARRQGGTIVTIIV